MGVVSAEAVERFYALLREEVQAADHWRKYHGGFATTQAILKEPADVQAEFVISAVQRLVQPESKSSENLSAGLIGRFLSLIAGGEVPAPAYAVTSRSIPLEQLAPEEKRRVIEQRVSLVLAGVLKDLVKHRVPLTADHVALLLELCAPNPGRLPAPLLNYLIRLAHKHREGEAIRSAMKRVRSGLERVRPGQDTRKQLKKIGQVLDDGPSLQESGGTWLQRCLEQSDGTAHKEEWRRVFGHAAQVGDAPSPSRRWRESATERIDEVGRTEFRKMALSWLEAGVTPGEGRRQLSKDESEAIKGFVWMLAEFGDREVAACVACVAEECFKKIPQIGAVSHKVGNACVNVLAEMAGMEAVGQLSRLRARMKYNTAKRLVERALVQAAERAGLTREDLEEIAVPTFGFEVPGGLRVKAGEYSAELTIVGTNQTELRWKTPQGKTVKSVPAEVKRDAADVVKSLKRTAKDVEQMLQAQRLRLEKLLLSEHDTRFEDWQKRTVEHPLLAQMTRRLIWRFERADGKRCLGAWQAGTIVGADDEPLQNLEAARTQIWHPLGTEIGAVTSWRRWLQEHAVTQPFKQAHREIYELTDAERRTDRYSNRFAAHIISQHVLNALCRERGWENRMQGEFDSGGFMPTLKLPEWGLRAEFWVEAPQDAPTSGSGISMYVATDQVRFCGLQGGAVRLEEVPARVFSEVMRDVDLFVGVASLANDPTWMDRGERQPYNDYWQRWSFGELSATALVRREVLAELLPKLKIRDRCSLEEKFLVVTGKRATYKIHLGSGNILMEPGSRYLCIVPGRSSDHTSGDRGPARIFLPFEGDSTLSIILSKALLLVEDDKITDPVILRQLPA